MQAEKKSKYISIAFPFSLSGEGAPGYRGEKNTDLTGNVENCNSGLRRNTPDPFLAVFLPIG